MSEIQSSVAYRQILLNGKYSENASHFINQAQEILVETNIPKPNSYEVLIGLHLLGEFELCSELASKLIKHNIFKHRKFLTPELFQYWSQIALQHQISSALETLTINYFDLNEIAIKVITLNPLGDEVNSLESQLNLSLNESIVGIDGASIPQLLIERAQLSSIKDRGTLGCFLSHTRSWELASNHLPTLVLEDDVFVSKALLNYYTEIFIKDKFDFMYINDRMAQIIQSNLDGKLFTSSIDSNSIPPGGHGTDGYLINANTASYLLDRVKKNLWQGNTDRFVLNCILGQQDNRIKYGIAKIPAVLHSGRRASIRKSKNSH